MTKDKKPLGITLRFNWLKTTPDPRQYNQQRQELQPFLDQHAGIGISIAVEIPLKREFVYNTADMLAAQISSDDSVPTPILTPQGMFLAISLLEAPFREETEERVDKALEDSDVDWGREEEETEDAETWDTSDEQSQFEPDETTIPNDDVGLGIANETPDWEDEKSWD